MATPENHRCVGRLRSILLVAALLAGAQVGAADVSATTVVKFNTVCARCHEGECSGRLSFSSGVAATQGHVRRHLPGASPLEVEELFAVLKYTKEHCSHYPLPDSVPAGGVWSGEGLRQWRSPDGDGYFIPLGNLRRGNYQLGLNFDRKAPASVRIADEKFEVLLEEQQCKDLAFRQTLQVSADARYFLYLNSSAMLLGLTLTPQR